VDLRHRERNPSVSRMGRDGHKPSNRRGRATTGQLILDRALLACLSAAAIGTVTVKL